jgi:putative membrane protein
MMLWYGDHWSWWGGALGLVLMLAFWGLVAWGIYAVARGTRVQERPVSRPDALSILDERLARGEIDQDRYRETRELIRTGRERGPAAPVGGAR